MDLVQTGVTLVTVIVGSGIIQFFVNRKDKKAEDDKNDRFKELEKEFQKGLDEREQTGLKRYEEHKLAIKEMNVQHQRDFQELQRAITQLTDNDTTIRRALDKMAEKQDIMADANVGMIHNTIVRFTEPILEREAVTYEELSTLDSLYLPYKRLGGNGECKRRYQDVSKLDKVSKETAAATDAEIKKRKFQEAQASINT